MSNVFSNPVNNILSRWRWKLTTLTLLLSFGEVSNNVSDTVFPKITQNGLKGLLIHTSNGWHLDVQPADASTRLVLHHIP